ncbi:protein NRT1/ PTR FAMILY 2.6-like protein [Cinnamomum micranthum f. kanehirae]|uniref:Protein NRT1/ PTR FAMILY 2.6-like protein n=1 Tax=Cinnamomum micranthum f. kanehirae TaxID=337451 RepID=A0A443NEF5_9MAGN|nr:protein NRT1/ PTR FAMILY 2.6-like protein [Cinnamomum micranthum f. kanehirae]
MAAAEIPPNITNSANSVQVTTSPDAKRGGWITGPFILVANLGLIMGVGGALSNLIVYLKREYNVKSIDASQISSIINGCTSVAPIAGAIIADSYLGCFCVIAVSAFVCLLGIVLMTLTATIHSLRPLPCTSGSVSCESPSTSQTAILFSGIALIAIGVGGTRFNIATMGANQFHKIKDQDSFFNWYFFTSYIAPIVAAFGIVYVQDNVGWGVGFGLCIVAIAISLAIFLLGQRYYRNLKPEGSPFRCLTHVVVAAIRKRNLRVTYDSKDYYYGHQGMGSLQPPSSSLSFLNRAALISQGDTQMDGLQAKPRALCTVDNVEDLKTILKIFPLWSTTIFLSTPIAIQLSLTVIQALSMDRRIGPHFSIPAGSFTVFPFLATAVTLPLVNYVLYPMWHKLIGRYPTPLQRIGVGHIINIISMMGFALVESRRLQVVHSHHLEDSPNSVAPISAMWLVVPQTIIGFGEALHFPGAVALYYQEFPKSLRSTGTAMTTLVIGISFYLSTAIVGLIRRVSTWLPNNMNQSRLDNVYWLLAVVGVLNFGYFLLCTWLYKYQSFEEQEKQ